jgi:hypothetical protein
MTRHPSLSRPVGTSVSSLVSQSTSRFVGISATTFAPNWLNGDPKLDCCGSSGDFHHGREAAERHGLRLGSSFARRGYRSRLRPWPSGVRQPQQSGDDAGWLMLARQPLVICPAWRQLRASATDRQRVPLAAGGRLGVLSPTVLASGGSQKEGGPGGPGGSPASPARSRQPAGMRV